MSRSVLKTTLAIMLVAAMAPLSACGDSSSKSSSENKSSTEKGADKASGDSLLVYSGRKENLIGPLLEKFTKKTGIKVEVKYDKSAALALLISEEGKKSPADVFISQSPGAIGFVGTEGLLGKIPQEQLDKVDAKLRSKEGTWVGMSGRVRTAVINTDKMSEKDIPDSVFDLTDAKYKGKIALPPTNGSFQDFVTAMRSEHGDEKTAKWLKGMADNDVVTFKNNSSTLKGVGAGEASAGLVNHYYNARVLKENPDAKTKNVFFKNGDIGSLLITTGIASLKSSKKTEEANKLIDFMLSEEAQNFFGEKTMEYPLAKGIKEPKGLPALDTLNYATVDMSTLAGGLKKTLSMIEDSGLAKK